MTGTGSDPGASPQNASATTAEPASPRAWPVWQRIGFRFFVVYLLLQIEPWNWFAFLPGLSQLAGWWFRLVNWSVLESNRRIFHVRDTLVPVNGSGDTSWAWTQFWLFLSVSAIACVVWSVIDRKRASYPVLGYWLRTMTRYYIAVAALSYGIIKLFALQMPFPSLSQLATPLGDLLPMRLSWLFLGYSAKYQFFSGAMETLAGLLLLYRPTVTLGLLTAAGAFANVVMINISYDVPVKLYASHLLFACVFLLAWDAKRLFTILVRNRAVSGTSVYEPPFHKRWQRGLALAAKAFLIFTMLVVPFRRGWERYRVVNGPQPGGPFPVGVYNVRTFVRNGDTVPPSPLDTVRWRDVIFDNAGGGSVGTADTMFWQRYRRGYFRFRPDTTRRTAEVWRTSFALDSTWLFKMRYERPDTNTIRLWTQVRADSIYVELARVPRHFQLAERQFHWLSEWNR